MTLALEFPSQTMNGILRCSRYAFGPNRLHYCGPDANNELLAYIKAGETDPGLNKMLSAFAALYPYLKLIARSNKIADPFDERVVEAYWLGNELLEKIDRQALYRNLLEEHGVKKKIGQNAFSKLETKIRQHAVPHHSFHVFNVWKQSGMNTNHTVETMDSCRVGWGKVVEVAGPKVTVETEPMLQDLNGVFYLGPTQKKALTRKLESTEEIEQLKPGDILTFHWEVPCEVISEKQMKTLKKYTLQNIAFLNQGV